MESLVHAMLSNALAVSVLAVVLAIVGRACRRPALIHGLCLVVMIKLVTPPFVTVTLPVSVGAILPATCTVQGRIDRNSVLATTQPVGPATAGESRFTDPPQPDREDRWGVVADFSSAAPLSPQRRGRTSLQ